MARDGGREDTNLKFESEFPRLGSKCEWSGPPCPPPPLPAFYFREWVHGVFVSQVSHKLVARRGRGHGLDAPDLTQATPDAVADGLPFALLILQSSSLSLKYCTGMTRGRCHARLHSLSFPNCRRWRWLRRRG